MTAPANVQRASDAQPVESFADSHGAILDALGDFGQLPELAVAAERTRTLAARMLALFDGGIREHHADEETQLFPAVLRSAAEGAERSRVRVLTERLTAEHRLVESLWHQLKPSVKRAASGSADPFALAGTADLVKTYTAHARFEEQEFLPLAREILARNPNHMAALGLALHLCHAPKPLAYI